MERESIIWNKIVTCIQQLSCRCPCLGVAAVSMWLDLAWQQLLVHVQFLLVGCSQSSPTASVSPSPRSHSIYEQKSTSELQLWTNDTQRGSCGWRKHPRKTCRIELQLFRLYCTPTCIVWLKVWRCKFAGGTFSSIGKCFSISAALPSEAVSLL